MLLWWMEFISLCISSERAYDRSGILTGEEDMRLKMASSKYQKEEKLRENTWRSVEYDGREMPKQLAFLHGNLSLLQVYIYIFIYMTVL